MKNSARVFLAVIASTVSFLIAVYLLVQRFGGLSEEDLCPLLKVSTVVALIAIILMHLPLHLIARAKGISNPLLYVLPGSIIPSVLVVVTRPLGSAQFKWIPLKAGVVAVLGAIVAITFWFVAPRGTTA